MTLGWTCPLEVRGGCLEEVMLRAVGFQGPVTVISIQRQAKSFSPQAWSR